jgi:altronate dehydratase
MDLGCEKTNLAQVERYLLKREKSFDKPVAKIGIQDVGGTQAAIEQGLKEVERMLPEVNRIAREECSVSELVLGREVWWFRWVLRDLCKSFARARCGSVGPIGWHGVDN